MRFPMTIRLSVILISVSLISAAPVSPMRAFPDGNPKANPFSPAMVLADASVLGRWEINSQDLGEREDPLNRGRAVFHFSADHKVELHVWSMSADSGGAVPVYYGSRMSETWFVRDTLLGIIAGDCEGLNTDGERECAFMKSQEGFGHDTDWNLVKFREGNRYLLADDMSAMLAFLYRGADRDVSAPSFWTAAASLRPRANGFRRKPGPAPEAPSYDLLGRRPAALPAATPRFHKPLAVRGDGPDGG